MFLIDMFLSMRNISIRNMRLKLGKNEETFKKHRQVDFQIITFKNCSY